MALDKISEIIAHFIGIFETAEDGARLREIAEGFDHTVAPEPTFDPLTAIEYLLRAPYEHTGGPYGLSDFQFTADTVPFVPAAPPSLFADAWLAPITSFSPTPLLDLKGGLPGNEHSFFLAGIPPGATVVIGHQMNVLVDHDFLVGEGTIGFAAPDYFDVQLATLTAAASGITQSLIGNPLTIITTAADFGEALGAQYGDLAQNAPDAAYITLVDGSEAIGVTVNGTDSEAMPLLDEVMPVYLQPDPLEDDATAQAPSGVGGNATAAAAVFDVDDGHNVVAGGNFAINEAIVAFSAVDAPVIAVMGDAICMVSISQVNIIQNHDGGALKAPSDVALNAATIAMDTSQIADEASDQSPPGLPQAWAVTRIDADLMTVNWIHQYNFVSDHDRAEVTFSGEDSFFGLGANTLLNQTSLLEIGVAYDLIIVGGQMIDMALISQTNVLLDDDHVSYSGDWPLAMTGDDNLALNAAVIDTVGIDSHTGLDGGFAQAGRDLADGALTISSDVAQSDYFAGIPFLNVLYIAGDLITITAIAQTNIIGDADQIDVTLEGLVAAADGPATVTAGSNAAVNIASIMEYGMDSTIMVGGEVYDDILLYQAELIETDGDPLDVTQAPLANEAVAFLADDMVDDAPVSDSVFAGQIDTSTTSVDVMGGVVA